MENSGWRDIRMSVYCPPEGAIRQVMPAEWMLSTVFWMMRKAKRILRTVPLCNALCCEQFISHLYKQRSLSKPDQMKQKLLQASTGASQTGVRTAQLQHTSKISWYELLQCFSRLVTYHGGGGTALLDAKATNALVGEKELPFINAS